MASGATECLFLQGAYEACIRGSDWEVERRPYHRNCGCALHKSRDSCSHSVARRTNISYPMRRSWSEGCLALLSAAAVASLPGSCSSPSTLPANVDVKRSWISRIGTFDLDNDSWDGEN